MMYENFDIPHLSHAIERLISSYPLLSAEEERSLARDGSEAAREELILCNLRLVKSIVLQFSGCGLELDDLFSEGEVALIRAVDKFNPSRGRLATYASHRIRGRIMDYIDKHRTLVHVPKPLRQQVNRFRRMLDSLGGSVSDERMAAVLDCSLKEVQEIRRCSAQSTESLEAPVGTDADEEDITLAECVGTHDADIAAVEARQDLDFFLARLKPEEAEVIRLQWGIGGGAPMSVREIAEVVGYGKSWVSETSSAAMKKMKQLAREMREQEDDPGSH